MGENRQLTAWSDPIRALILLGIGAPHLTSLKTRKQYINIQVPAFNDSAAIVVVVSRLLSKGLSGSAYIAVKMQLGSGGALQRSFFAFTKNPGLRLATILSGYNSCT